MSEWVIPFQDIEIIELIGRGRMGEVYKWVKLRYYDYHIWRGLFYDRYIEENIR